MTPHDVLDLTDGSTHGVSEAAAYDNDGVRALLAALQLKPVSGPMVDAPRGDVFDLAVFRATGDHRLAALFGAAS